MFYDFDLCDAHAEERRMDRELLHSLSAERADGEPPLFLSTPTGHVLHIEASRVPGIYQSIEQRTHCGKTFYSGTKTYRNLEQVQRASLICDRCMKTLRALVGSAPPVLDAFKRGRPSIERRQTG